MNYLMIFAIICAFIVKGMCGFANTLVFSSILSFQTNNINITPVELLTGYLSNIIMAWKERKNLEIKVWLPLSILVIIGAIPGIFLLKNGDVTSIKIFFGVIVTLIGIEMFCREYQKKKRKASGIFLVLIGVLSGFLCGLFGIGALLAAYISRTTDSSSAFRGNICVVFIIENTFRIVLYSITGIMTLAIVKQAVILFPFMHLGLGLGILLSKVLNESVVKKAVIILLILSGISLILTNLLS